MKSLAEEVGGPIQVEEEEEEGEEGGGTAAAAVICSDSCSSSSRCSRSSDKGREGRGEDNSPEYEEGGLEDEGPAAGVTEGEGGGEDVAGHLAEDDHELSLFLHATTPMTVFVPEADD